MFYITTGNHTENRDLLPLYLTFDPLNVKNIKKMTQTILWIL